MKECSKQQHSMAVTETRFEKQHVHIVPVSVTCGHVCVRGFSGLPSPDGFSQASWSSMSGTITTEPLTPSLLHPPPTFLSICSSPPLSAGYYYERCYSNTFALPNLLPLVRPSRSQCTQLQTHPAPLLVLSTQQELANVLLKSALKYVITSLKTSSCLLFNTISEKVEVIS